MCVCPSQVISQSLSRKRLSHQYHIKLGTVTASDMLMQHMLIILILTFIQGHTDLNHGNNKCLIIIYAMPIRFAVEKVQLKVYNNHSSLMTLTFVQSHECVSNFLTYNIWDNIYAITLMVLLSMAVDLW